MASPGLPIFLSQFPTCTVTGIPFRSMLLNVWAPGGISADGFPYIKCRLCPVLEGYSYIVDLEERQLFYHLVTDHFEWWTGLGWGHVPCPLSYSSWVSTLNQERWENDVALNNVWESDSDCSSEQPPSPMTDNSGPYEDYWDKRKISEEF